MSCLHFTHQSVTQLEESMSRIYRTRTYIHPSSMEVPAGTVVVGEHQYQAQRRRHIEMAEQRPTGLARLCVLVRTSFVSLGSRPGSFKLPIVFPGVPRRAVSRYL